MYIKHCVPSQVGSSDIGGVNIIAFRQINQFDLSGNVHTSPEHLPTLSVGLLGFFCPCILVLFIELAYISATPLGVAGSRRVGIVNVFLLFLPLLCPGEALQE